MESIEADSSNGIFQNLATLEMFVCTYAATSLPPTATTNMPHFMYLLMHTTAPQSLLSGIIAAVLTKQMCQVNGDNWK